MTQPARIYLAKRANQAGLSLVELMVAVTIGLILMVVILQIFLGSKDSYRSTDNHARLQENGRYITEEMFRDIRMAGYRGCSKTASMNNIAEPVTNTWISFNEAVHGYERADLPPNFGLSAAEVLTGTDVIRVQGAFAPDVRLTGNMGTTNANIQITGNPDSFAADDILLISDCVNADTFRANNVSVSGGIVTITHPNSVNTGVNLSKAYGINAEVMRLSTNIYYIGAGTATDCPANMLCRKVLSGPNLIVEQLIDNVENMQLEYGEDTDGDLAANRFVNAATITNWNNIVSVRLHLLLRSNDINVASSPQPYTFNGATPATPTDRRIRRVFSSTITLRNRTL